MTVGDAGSAIRGSDERAIKLVKLSSESEILHIQLQVESVRYTPIQLKLLRVCKCDFTI